MPEVRAERALREGLHEQEEDIGGSLRAHLSTEQVEDGRLTSAPEDTERSGPGEVGDAPRAQKKTSFEIDYNDWQLDRRIFLRLQRLYGPFDLDGACDDKGKNSHVATYCSPSNNFLDADFAGKNVFLNVPFDKLGEFIGHYLRTKQRDPSTR